MPLLVIALITHVVYKMVTDGMEWGADTSRSAWNASMAKSAALGDRIRQALADQLDLWEQSPRAKGYVAWGLKAIGKTARGVGKGGLWGFLAGARAAGAIVRALGGGALATGGFFGWLAQAIRTGTANGSKWWYKKYGEKASDRAREWADRWRRWGETHPGESWENDNPGGDDQGGDDSWTEEPPPGGDRESWGNGGGEDTEWPEPEFPEEPTPDHDKREWTASEPEVDEESDREPYQAGEATVGNPDGEPVPKPAAVGSTPHATPVTSGPAGSPAVSGTATAVIDREPDPAIEGNNMTTVATTNGSSPAVFPAGTDGLQYEAAQAFLANQADRAKMLGTQVEQLVALMQQIASAASVMQQDHEIAQIGLTRFNVTAPNVADAITMLSEIVRIPAEALLIHIYQQLDLIHGGCLADADDLTARFGEAWARTRAENIDGQFYNG